MYIYIYTRVYIHLVFHFFVVNNNALTRGIPPVCSSARRSLKYQDLLYFHTKFEYRPLMWNDSSFTKLGSCVSIALAREEKSGSGRGYMLDFSSSLTVCCLLPRVVKQGQRDNACALLRGYIDLEKKKKTRGSSVL